MSQSLQMVQRELRGLLVIQHDICDPCHWMVSGHGYRGDGGRFLHGGIHGDEALDSARKEQLRVTGHQLGIVPVDHGQKKVVALLEVLLDGADDLRAVGITDFRCNYADSESTPKPQRARKKLGR